MKLGDVLKKERENKGLSTAEVAEKLGLAEAEYLKVEAGESPAELWCPHLAHIALVLDVEMQRLLAETGRFADCKAGQAGPLVRGYRETREMSEKSMVEALNNWESEMGSQEGYRSLTTEDYQQIEAGNSPIEKYGPLLLGFAETVGRPLFNLLYPVGMPFQDLDDY